MQWAKWVRYPSFPNAQNAPSLLCHERFNEASLSDSSKAGRMADYWQRKVCRGVVGSGLVELQGCGALCCRAINFKGSSPSNSRIVAFTRSAAVHMPTLHHRCNPSTVWRFHTSTILIAAVSSLTAGVSAIAIACGDSHTCIIAAGGGVKCWGYNGHGQLGIGSTSNAWSPVDVTGAGRAKYSYIFS
jgi:hypothetical protein